MASEMTEPTIDTPTLDDIELVSTDEADTSVSTTVDAPAPVDPVANGPSGAEAATEQPPPEGGTRRQRSPRKRTTKAAAPASAPAAQAPLAPAEDGSGDTAPADATPGAPAVSFAPPPVPEPHTSAATSSAPSEQGTARTSANPFGLIFQAPEPVVPVRRAPAPATPPLADEPKESDTVEASADDEADSAPDDGEGGARRRRRRGGKGRQRRADEDTPEEESEAPATASETSNDAAAADEDDADAETSADGEGGSRRRTRRRRRSGGSGDAEDAPGVVTKVRPPRRDADEVTGVKGSTRLEAKKRRRREGREAGRRRTVITEAEFLARRESVERVMVVRGEADRTQIAVLEDDVLVEHYVSRETTASMVGNIYLGRVQNVLPSMEAAFVDIGRGRNAVLYSGEVNWVAAGLEAHQARRIENALEPGQAVMVQVTKDPIGHKGARLTSQISLPGRFLVYVPDSSMTGISRKLPDTERARLKKILRDAVPESAGVIVRTAAEGASEEELGADIDRLTTTWDQITQSATSAGWGKKGKTGAPHLLHGEPQLTVRVIRDIFNEDFGSLVVSGEQAWQDVGGYVSSVAPDLESRVTRWTGETDAFTHFRVDEQIAKAMDRKVWLPSGGSLVIDRTEAMTVIDVNTGKFVGSGGDLEETVTRNNLEAAEEIVRQLRLRDIGGIIVVDFIDMVLESNRDLVVRRLLECLGRDRTKHQVAEVSSLGLVQMTRKRVGSGLLEVFSTTCDHCNGRGYLVHSEPVERGGGDDSGGNSGNSGGSGRSRGRRGRSGNAAAPAAAPTPPPPPAASGPTPAQIAAAAHAAAVKSQDPAADDVDLAELPGAETPVRNGPVLDSPVPDASSAPPQTGASEPPESAPGTADVVPTAVSVPEEDDADVVAEVALSAVPDVVVDVVGDDEEDAPPAGAQAEQPELPGQIEEVNPVDVEEAGEGSGSDEQSGSEGDSESGEQPSGEAGARRPRRRRGRVIAPAGPPPPLEP